MNDFSKDLARGLRERPKRISPKYFYDERGSALFDAICDLEEYYLTRTELEILRLNVGDLASRAGTELRVVELGSGSGKKTRALLDALVRPVEYLAVDVSQEPLEAAAAALRDAFPKLKITPVWADFSGPFALPPTSARGTLFYFPGATIGNLTPDEATDLLRRLRGTGACAMILGVDLKKNPARLHAAYNDREGVTAAFNKNLIARANRELGADFDLDAFAHYAPYVPAIGRIEMHLVSLRTQRVHFAGESFHFARGESLLTEYSYKYERAEVSALAKRGGFEVSSWHADPRDDFAVALLQTPDFQG